MSNGRRSEGGRITGGSGTGKTRAGFNVPQTLPMQGAAVDPGNTLHPSNQGGTRIDAAVQPARISPVTPGATSSRDAGRRSR
jgi:hypothetical protein